MSDDTGIRDSERGEDRISSAFERTVDEGRSRLKRSWPGLLATGMIGGLDVGLGLLAFFVVKDQSGSTLAAAAAFPIGFIALSLANSELFTENFLVPVAAVVARESSVLSVARLWLGAAVTNLAGGWVITGLVIAALPGLRAVAVADGANYVALGITWRAFASALLGGMVMTLLTWMQHSTESVPAKLIAAVAAGFLLVSPPLDHAIVGSLAMFAALHAGAPFGYADWLGTFGWAVMGNVVGGIGLVTALRLVQVGREKLEEEREAARN